MAKRQSVKAIAKDGAQAIKLAPIMKAKLLVNIPFGEDYKIRFNYQYKYVKEGVLVVVHLDFEKIESKTWIQRIFRK